MIPRAIILIITLILQIFFVVKRWSAFFFLHSCIYKYALHTAFIMEANSMKADQTAPRGAVWSGYILFAI